MQSTIFNYANLVCEAAASKNDLKAPIRPSFNALLANYSRSFNFNSLSHNCVHKRKKPISKHTTLTHTHKHTYVCRVDDRVQNKSDPNNYFALVAYSHIVYVPQFC